MAKLHLLTPGTLIKVKPIRHGGMLTFSQLGGIPLQLPRSADYFPCSAAKIPLFGRAAEFRFTTNRINYLEG
jgi:hypothetical protein